MTEAEYKAYRLQAQACQVWAAGLKAQTLALPDRPLSVNQKRARPYEVIEQLSVLVVALLDEVKTKH